MPKLPWFRAYTEILDDPKMARLSGDQFRDWVYVLAMAREAEEPGLIAMSAEEAAWRVRRPVDEFRLSLELFESERFGMVALTEDSIRVIHFSERQKDKPSDQPGKVRERVKRHRERHGNVGETLMERPGNAGAGEVKRSGNATDKSRLEEIRLEEIRGEEKDLAPPPPDMTTQEREILHALINIDNYPYDVLTDLKFVRGWLVRFPQADLLTEIDKCVTWWADKKGKGNWRLRVRNWFEKSEEIRNERETRKPSSPPSHPSGPPIPSPETLAAMDRVRHIYGEAPPAHKPDGPESAEALIAKGGEPT